MEIKNDLGTEVRALTKRMAHIDEQISQIFKYLSPTNISVADNLPASPKIDSPGLLNIPASSTTVPLLPSSPTMSPETNVSSISMSPLFDAPSFYSDLNAKMSLFDDSGPMITTTTTTTDVLDHSRPTKTNEQTMTTPAIDQASDHDTSPISMPPPPSIYNRSATSSIISLGASATPRGSVSNKIAPAPAPPSPINPKHPLAPTIQPISNTRFNPGRSPKPKVRSHHGRAGSKQQRQQPERSTIIDLEPSTQENVSSKNVPLLAAPSKTTPSGKPSGNVFRRFITSGGNTEKTVSLSSPSSLLYPPTSDDEHPMSPASSGNDDDDYRLLTGTSSKHHHQTPL